MKTKIIHLLPYFFFILVLFAFMGCEKENLKFTDDFKEMNIDPFEKELFLVPLDENGGDRITDKEVGPLNLKGEWEYTAEDPDNPTAGSDLQGKLNEGRPMLGDETQKNNATAIRINNGTEHN